MTTIERGQRRPRSLMWIIRTVPGSPHQFRDRRYWVKKDLPTLIEDEHSPRTLMVSKRAPLLNLAGQELDVNYCK